MKINIRQEIPTDYKIVAEIIESAFKNEPYSDQTEHLLVERLRYTKAFIPELSLVAEYRGQVVGHILLTKIKIKDGHFSFDSLALAPVSVKPNFQGKGIGGQLINKAHEAARALGLNSIVLIGHENYYPRFGYERASKYGIKLPFEAPDKNCMVIALTKNGLDGVRGMVENPKTFFEH